MGLVLAFFFMFVQNREAKNSLLFSCQERFWKILVVFTFFPQAMISSSSLWWSPIVFFGFSYSDSLFCIFSIDHGVFWVRGPSWSTSLSGRYNISCWLHYTEKTGEYFKSLVSIVNRPMWLFKLIDFEFEFSIHELLDIRFNLDYWLDNILWLSGGKNWNIWGQST